ncbi:GtrA family protein [Methanothrix sp.]|jgi:putative flippase GtrA|uniref:GtrA family protein n=2 Tax=Methanothrix sp. TaxID=90426 RepID=UPI003C7932B0
MLSMSDLKSIGRTGRGRFVYKFALVGATGAVVNLAVLWFLTEHVHIYYVISALIAIESSIVWNFFLNTRATFNYDFMDMGALFSAMFRYHIISFAGMLINLSALFALTEGAKIHYLVAESLAILIVFIFNYLSSINYVWHNPG